MWQAVSHFGTLTKVTDGAKNRSVGNICISILIVLSQWKPFRTRFYNWTNYQFYGNNDTIKCIILKLLI